MSGFAQTSPRTALEMDRRMTTMEVQLLNMSTKLDLHIEQTRHMIDRLDQRQDKSDIFMARLVGGLVVAQFLAILFAPVIRAALGLST